MNPVTAMTTFFPFVDCQNVVARFCRWPVPVALIVELIDSFQSCRVESPKIQTAPVVDV